MGLFHRKEEKAAEGEVLAACLTDPIASEIFQDILRDNGIPFVRRNQGAGGYMKVMFGASAAADFIYVSAADELRAKELYEAYLGTEVADENEEN